MIQPSTDDLGNGIVINVNGQIKNLPEYRTVNNVLTALDSGGLLERLAGNCISAADIIQSLLDAEGVTSRIVECNLVATQDTGDFTNLALIGFNSINGVVPSKSHIDTHAVVLVECKYPFIVDASIGHNIGNPKFVVISQLSDRDPDVIAETQFENINFVYRVKKNIKLATLHQKTLLERVKGEAETRSRLKWVDMLVKIAVGLSVLNVIFNIALLSLKIVSE